MPAWQFIGMSPILYDIPKVYTECLYVGTVVFSAYVSYKTTRVDNC